MMQPKPLRTFPGARSPHTRRLWSALLLCIAVVGQVAADEIRIGKHWQRQATVEQVSDGQIIFTNSVGTEQVKDLAQITAMKVSGYVQLGQAHEAIDKRDDKAALALLTQLQSRVRPPWLKHWVGWQRMNVLARLGRPIEAVIAYFQLDRSGADAFYLRRPPSAALEAASQSQKRQIHKRLTQTLPQLSDAARKGVQTMLAQLGPMDRQKATSGTDAKAPGAPQPDGGSVGSGKATQGGRVQEIHAADKVGMPTSDKEPVPVVGTDSVVVLPTFIQRDDPVTKHLCAGRFAEALTMLAKALDADQVVHANMRWYQRGIARCAVADRETDLSRAQELYKQAGLDFMRVVSYFPTGRYLAACLVETAYVHQKIGRPAKARQLCGQVVKGTASLTKQTEPEYYERLHTLLRQLNADLPYEKQKRD